MKNNPKIIKYGFNPTQENRILFSDLKMKYIQECDEYSDDLQELSIETNDNGGGMYFVIKTDRWAFDNIDELINIINDFKKRIEI